MKRDHRDATIKKRERRAQEAKMGMSCDREGECQKESERERKEEE